MNKKLFIEKYKKFDFSDIEVNSYIKTITQFEEYVGKDIADTSIEDIKSYFKYLISIKENKYGNVIHFTLIKNKNIYIWHNILIH